MLWIGTCRLLLQMKLVSNMFENIDTYISIFWLLLLERGRIAGTIETGLFFFRMPARRRAGVNRNVGNDRHGQSLGGMCYSYKPPREGGWCPSIPTRTQTTPLTIESRLKTEPTLRNTPEEIKLGQIGGAFTGAFWLLVSKHLIP